MAGGVKFDADVAELYRFAIGDGLGAAGKIVAVAQPHHVERLLSGQHRAMAGPGVVGMAMGDHGALDRPHRIDMKAAGLAAQSGGDRHQDVLRTHLRYIGGVAAFFTSPHRGEVAAPKRSEGVAGEGSRFIERPEPSPGETLRVPPNSPRRGEVNPRRV